VADSRVGTVGNDSMGVKRQQGESDRQLSLFDDEPMALPRHGASGEGGTGTSAREESRSPTVSDPARALTQIRGVATLKETAGYGEYVRWCGRTGASRPPSYPIVDASWAMKPHLLRLDDGDDPESVAWAAGSRKVAHVDARHIRSRHARRVQ